jgi:hypothetical protein
MSVADYAADDLFILRVIKSLVTNPDNKWANSYEFQAIDPGNEAGILTLMLALVLFEASMHNTSVIFDRCIASTWEADSKPYNPEAFASSTLTANGSLVGTTDLLALNQALVVARQTGTGRAGHLFYRAHLVEGDVVAPAGRITLVSKPDMQTRLGIALADGELGGYIGPDATSFRMVMINKDGSQIRPVISLKVAGATSIKTDHKWFNRTTPTPP